MPTYTVQTEIRDDQRLRLDIPCDLPAGPVEVLVVVGPRPAGPASQVGRNWEEWFGLGKEIWEGVDPLDYVRELREDRELPQ